MSFPSKRVLLMFLPLLAALNAEASPVAVATWVPDGGSEPLVEAIRLDGSLTYKKMDQEMTEFGVISENQVTLSLLPFYFEDGPLWDRPAEILPLSITFDASTKKVTEADITLFRSWIVSLLSYRRDLFAAEDHDFGLIRITYPIYVMSNCDADNSGECLLQTSIVITIGAELGYRWMRGGNHGLYTAPNSAATLGITVLNRFFLGMEGYAGFSMMTGDQPNYAKAKVGARIGVKFSDELMLSFTAGWGFYGSKEIFGLPKYSNYLGARLDWNLP